MCPSGAHDVRGLDIAEDKRRLLAVQVREYGAELLADIQYFIEWEPGTVGPFEILFQRLARNKAHYHVPAAILLEVFKDGG